MEDKAKIAADRIMQRIIPIREAAIKKAELLFEEGKKQEAWKVMAEGLSEVNEIIHAEMLKHVMDEVIMKQLKQMLGIKNED